jgi:mono/diheme cytochrome c family protein
MPVRAALALAALLLAGPALAEPPADHAASIARGRALVTQDCGPCHAVGTSGLSPNPLAPHFRALGQRYPVEDIGEALAEGMIVGHSPMPEWKFTSDEVADIVAYLQSIQAPPGAGQP